ncbi:MAG: hypothetical protein OQJ77_03075 [Thiovulaceae bacterium]|nr:hypothetical protein [Sulfurimonadaceae bacterium]MCW9026274.1 hypothetical protein [Sulfurimonadaceae bacterium]
MQLKLEFVIYNESLDEFELDEVEHLLELDDEQTTTFNLLKDSDLYLYNWLKDSDFFIDWIKEEVYPDSIGKKIAIRSINDLNYTRFYFFKVTSGDIHYEYFKKLFDIYHDIEWQDREEVGKEILNRLKVKRKELIIELQEDCDLEEVE